MGVFDRGMLRVEHAPPTGAVVGPADLQALVAAHSGAALTTVDLVYRPAGGGWTVVPMTDQGGGRCTGRIPAQSSDTDVEYYVQAADASGRHRVVAARRAGRPPRAAPAGAGHGRRRRAGCRPCG